MGAALTRERQVGAADTQRIRQLVTGYQAARALLAADELGVVRLLESGSKSAEELAHGTGMHAPSLYRFLRALSTVDLIEEDSEGRFSLGPLAGGLRDAARIGVESYRAWAELPFSLRTGKPAFSEVYGKPLYDYLSEDEVRAARFDSALAAVSRDWGPAVFEAYDFGGFRTVVDIGGGRGTFLATLLEAYPTIKGVLFDMPQVVEHAGPILEDAGVAERCRCVGGNFFEAVPEGADAYTLCNLLTDWDNEHAIAILKTCQRAMPPHARVLVIDRVLPPTGNPNRQAMAFLDLFFLVLEGGSIRTSDDFTQILAAAGLEVSRVIPTSTTFSIVEARHNS
jgi:hypothetical protein